MIVRMTQSLFAVASMPNVTPKSILSRSLIHRTLNMIT